MCREVLLSYRVLFGQEKKSRKFFRQLRKDEDATDALLETLCLGTHKEVSSLPSRIFPDSCMNVNGFLRHQDSYSQTTDFPILGRRLLVLQEWNLKHNPIGMLDMWKDKRNPLQRFTFCSICIGTFATVMLTVVVVVLTATLVALDAKRERSHDGQSKTKDLQ